MSSFQLECSVLKKSWGNLLFGKNEMTREKLEKYIQNNYSAEPVYPWVKYPDYEVFRHTSNKKWFALIMEIPKDKLGLQTKDILSVVNFKCDPIMIGSFLNKEGYFPAYHMNKTSWIIIVIAREAGAVYKVGNSALINTELFEKYLERFREPARELPKHTWNKLKEMTNTPKTGENS